MFKRAWHNNILKDNKNCYIKINIKLIIKDNIRMSVAFVWYTKHTVGVF